MYNRIIYRVISHEFVVCELNRISLKYHALALTPIKLHYSQGTNPGFLPKAFVAGKLGMGLGPPSGGQPWTSPPRGRHLLLENWA